jgi:hypothetical protein
VAGLSLCLRDVYSFALQLSNNWIIGITRQCATIRDIIAEILITRRVNPLARFPHVISRFPTRQLNYRYYEGFRFPKDYFKSWSKIPKN